MPRFMPSGKEPRLPSPLGGPHILFDGSFQIEFLQPPPDLNATVLMRATYIGRHELMNLGKTHPQAPPLHIHFYQSESFIVEAGAIGTTCTYDAIDTIHTTAADYPQKTPRPGLSPPLPSRDSEGVTEIPPWTPHQFWPVSPKHAFWSTPEGSEYETSLPNGRYTDTVLLIWGHPRTRNGPPTGNLTTDFPPDMDAAFFLGLLTLVDAVNGQRVKMSLGLGAALMSMQTASGAALVIAPTAWWLGPLRWAVPWGCQRALDWGWWLFNRRNAAQLVEDIIEEHVVKRQ